MKIIYSVLFFFVLLISLPLQAQYDWEAQANVNAFWGGKIQFVEGEMDIGNGVSSGISIQRNAGYRRYVGVNYNYIGTDIKFTPYRFYENDFPERQEDMNIHMIYVKATQELGDDAFTAVPYFDAGAGMIIYDFKDSRIDGGVRFLINMGLGCKINVSDRFGLNVSGKMQMPFVGQGAGLYCGIGPGGSNCGVSAYGTVLVVLWELGGGLIFKF